MMKKWIVAGLVVAALTVVYFNKDKAGLKSFLGFWKAEHKNGAGVNAGTGSDTGEGAPLKELKPPAEKNRSQSQNPAQDQSQEAPAQATRSIGEQQAAVQQANQAAALQSVAAAQRTIRTVEEINRINRSNLQIQNRTRSQK